MTRRRLVVLVSAAVMLFFGIAAITVFVIATRSDYGRERILRKFIEPLIASHINGKIFIGRLGGNLLDSVTIDSLEIRGQDGQVFARTGRIMAKFDLRDFWDERIYLRRLAVEHPYLHFVQRSSGNWNFNEVFKGGNPQPQPLHPQRGGWGSYFAIDSASIKDGRYLLTLPWHVDDNLRSAARDSAIRYNLARDDRKIERSGSEFTRTYDWRNISGFVARARLADPDSDAAGREIKIATLNVDEFDPPFNFRGIRGLVRHLGDSVWFEAHHFDLPRSTGSGSGKIFWGHNLPIRYNISVRGDSVALDDVNWVYPTLPRTGGGSVLLHIQNDPKNLGILNFKLSKMDVRSTKSHLVGAMSFGTGAPLLLVRDVDLKADPVDFDLLRTLAGKPFPVDWQGRIVGTVKARGGVLTNFFVDDARGDFYDGHVVGATTHFAGHGELDILQPALTVFHGFQATVSPLDLRTIEYLYPAFPVLGGVVSGTATLDSSWLDVRFSNASIEHQDGPGEPSRLTGSGRITYGVPFMGYDVTLQAEPLSLTMLSRSYPAMPFRGLVTGPIRAKGTTADLELTTSLRGAPGALSFDGRVDVDSVGGFGAHGRGEFTGFDLRQLLARSTIPAGTFNGQYNVDLTGATVADLRGRAALDLEQSIFDGVRLFPSRALVRFADGRMFVDSVHLRSDMATVSIAGGALGLRRGIADSLAAKIVVDSLGGFRRYLAPVDSALPGVAKDSLVGSFTLNAIAKGRIDSLDLRGRLEGTGVFLRGVESQPSLEFELTNALAAPSGALRLSATHVNLAGVALDTVAAIVNVASRTHASFTAAASRMNGPQFAAAGQLVDSANFKSLLLQSLTLDVGSGHWRLSEPARLDADSAGGLRLGSVEFRSGDSAVVALSGDVPATGPVTAQLRASRLPVADFGLASYTRQLNQLTDLAVRVTGTKARPQIDARATLVATDTGGFERATATASYANARLNGQLALLRKGQNAFTATGSIPMDVTLFSARMPNDSLTFSINADSADLGILQTFAPKTFKDASGLLTMHVNVANRWRSGGSTWTSILNLAPRGEIRVDNGRMVVIPLGTNLLDLKAHATLDGKKLLIDNLSASSTNLAKKPNWIRLTGSVTNLADAAPSDSVKLGYDLKLLAQDFHVIDRRTLANLDVTSSDGLTLTGATGAVDLRGALTVERGQVFLPDPEIARKRLAEIAFDTTTSGTVSNADAVLASLGLRSMEVTVSLGQDVKLKSTAADVKLTGSVVVGTLRVSSARTTSYPMTVNGALLANSGTYTLDFGNLVKRDFTVTRGRVNFDNSTNPDVDISAIYRVKRQGKEDIGVIVNVRGPLVPGPKIEFSSDQTYAISQSDLLSYLITNEAGFDFTTNPAMTQALSFIAPTLSSYASAGLRDKLGLGNVFDQVQFQGAAVSSADGTNTNLGKSGIDFFNGATLNGQKQVGENAFFSLNAGLCAFTSQKSQLTPLSPLDAFAGSFEYRFPVVTLQASVESSTQARYCNAAGSLTSLAPTPRQLSLVLRKSWRF